jgi:hypothetical protein
VIAFVEIGIRTREGRDSFVEDGAFRRAVCDTW